jgi:2-C-methyl-D-erythritol 4-phosphate cytidylyltransferase
MLEWSVVALRAVAAVRQIVVALPADAVELAPAGTIGVPGGAVRSESVRRALAAAGDRDDPVVLVHDAARPLATPQLFQRAIDALEASSADAVVAALPVSDTIKEVAPGSQAVTRTLERPRLWAVQTPQVFRRSALERALHDASDSTLAGATDDAWLIEQDGGTVHVVMGEASNIKVTVPADLRIAELLLAERAV